MEKGRHKIAHVITESIPFGGAQRNTLVTLKGLARDGYETELICGPGGPLIQEARAVDVPVHVIRDLVRQVDPTKDFRAFLRLLRLFQSNDYQIVHTHSTKAGLLGRLAAWWAGIPVIVHTVHGYPFEMNGNLRSKLYILVERFVGLMTDQLVCVGEVIKQEMSAWKVAPEKKLATIYSGIDFSSYVPKQSAVEMKRELSLDGAWPIIGSIGHLVEAKAQHYLIQTVALLKEKYPRIKLLIAGEGRTRPVLERQIRDLNLSSEVSLLGERSDVADLLSVFDFYAMSSKYEGVGRAMTEAMYWGLPIVATSVNGVKEFILDKETGLLVPPRDPKALAGAIEYLVSNPETAKRMGVNARKKAREIMDAQKMVLAIEKLYGKLSMEVAQPRQVRA